MRACASIPLAVAIPGQKMPRLNLLCPLYGRTSRGRRRADFTRTARLAIRSIDRRETV